MSEKEKSKSELSEVSTRSHVTLKKVGGRVKANIIATPDIMGQTFSDIEGILTIYDLPQDIGEPRNEKIVTYLLGHQYLIPILREAKNQIKRFFGDVLVILELEEDPEEDWKELFGIIKVQIPMGKALQLQEKFYEEWFSPISRKFKSFPDLNFHVERM
jgi:hypothetical protein